MADFLAAALEQNDGRDCVLAAIFCAHFAVWRERRGNGNGEDGHSAIEQKFLVLLARRRLHAKRRGGGCSRGVVAVAASVLRKIRSEGRGNGKRVPGNASVGLVLVERRVVQGLAGLHTAGVWIPFCDHAFGKTNVDRYRSLCRRVEVEHGRFHAHGATQTELVATFLKLLDEAREVGRAGQRRPLDSIPIPPCDREERSPFMDGEAGIYLRCVHSGRGGGDDSARYQQADSNRGGDL